MVSHVCWFACVCAKRDHWVSHTSLLQYMVSHVASVYTFCKQLSMWEYPMVKTGKQRSCSHFIVFNTPSFIPWASGCFSFSTSTTVLLPRLSSSKVSLAECGLPWIPDSIRRADFTFPFLICFEPNGMASFLVWSSAENVLVNFCWMVLPSSILTGRYIALLPQWQPSLRTLHVVLQLWSAMCPLKEQMGHYHYCGEHYQFEGVDSPNALSNLDVIHDQFSDLPRRNQEYIPFPFDNFTVRI